MIPTSTSCGTIYYPTQEIYSKEVDITLLVNSNVTPKQFYKMLNKLLSELDSNWEVKSVITSIEKN